MPLKCIHIDPFDDKTAFAWLIVIDDKHLAEPMIVKFVAPYDTTRPQWTGVNSKSRGPLFETS